MTYQDDREELIWILADEAKPVSFKDCQMLLCLATGYWDATGHSSSAPFILKARERLIEITKRYGIVVSFDDERNVRLHLRSMRRTGTEPGWLIPVRIDE